MKHSSLALTWALSSLSGYGIYGLQIALQFLRRGGEHFIATHQTGQVILPTLTHVKLAPILTLANKIAEVMARPDAEPLAFNHPVLYAVGNECAGFDGQDRVSGSVTVGCAAIEHASFSEPARNYAKNYDMFITISRWNEAFFRSLDIAPVHLCHQGIDTSLFCPGSSTGLWNDRFLVFSGGKFEFRKGQDLVVAAFKRFREKHPEALLITAWQTLLPLDPEPFALAGHCVGIPEVHPQRGLITGPWLAAQGLPQDSVLELPYTPNMLMPAVLRECHAAIFPNRCEGGTNLVAMEAMACGVPTCVANNTGQKDLVDLIGCDALIDQKTVRQGSQQKTTQDWGESNVDEIVAFLEKTFTDYQAQKEKALKTAEKMKAWDWGPKNESLLKIVCD